MEEKSEGGRPRGLTQLLHHVSKKIKIVVYAVIFISISNHEITPSDKADYVTSAASATVPFRTFSGSTQTRQS